MINIYTKNLCKKFSEKIVLDDISFKTESGEIFGLLGPSGAGKTTIIKILTGQLSYKGTAEIFGKSCSSIGKDIYPDIGVMADNCGVYELLTCYDNMKIFAAIYGVGKKRIDEILEYVGLSNARKTQVSRMSKGMKQRLLLSVAIIKNPKILFLDEPTSGLDPTASEEIHKLLLEIKNNGTTIFLTTHNMYEAEKLCGNIALLNSGKIIECGKPQEICLKYDQQNIINILLKDGDTVQLANSSENADKISDLIRSQTVKSIHSSEPTLESVFMNLTGKRLNV